MPCKWTEWGECSVTCGTGHMYKSCMGGIGEGNTKTMVCKKLPCEEDPVTPWVDHGCTQWGEWEMCSRTCGEGVSFRVCMGGSEKNKKESRRCHLRPCHQIVTTTAPLWVPTTTGIPGVSTTPPKGPCMHWNSIWIGTHVWGPYGNGQIRI